MFIRCHTCGVRVSNAVLPDFTFIRAYVECPECIAKDRIVTNLKLLQEVEHGKESNDVERGKGGVEEGQD